MEFVREKTDRPFQGLSVIISPSRTITSSFRSIKRTSSAEVAEAHATGLIAGAGFAARNNSAVSSQSHWPDELFDEFVHLQRCGDNRFARLARSRAAINSRMVGKVYHITKVLATIDTDGKMQIVPFGAY